MQKILRHRVVFLLKPTPVSAVLTASIFNYHIHIFLWTFRLEFTRNFKQNIVIEELCKIRGPKIIRTLLLLQ